MAVLLPLVRARFGDSNNNPLSGGKLWSYQAGTTTPRATYTDNTGTTPNTNPVILDSAGYADIWLNPGTYKFVLMDANDVVLWTRDGVKPADGGGGGITDEDYIASGYSLEFGRAVDLTGLQDIIDDIYRWGYLAHTVSLSSNAGTGPYEKGAAITAINFTAAIVKKSAAIAEVRFYKGATLLDTQTSGGAIPAGGSSAYSWSGSFTDNTTFSAQVDDGTSTVTSTRVFSYVYPYYVGAGSTSLTASSVAGLTKRILSSTTSRVETIGASAGNVFYFAYPASYGALTSILDVNNFETIGDWTLRTENITGLDSSAVSYRIYEFKNPVVAGSYQYTFKR